MLSPDGEDNNSAKNNREVLEQIAQTVGDKVKGVIQATKNYSIILNDRTSAVNIVDNVSQKWFVRIDNAHKNVNFNHINVNKKITGLPDPHTAISSSTLKSAENIAKFCKLLNKVLVPAVVIIDTARIGVSVWQDCKQGTVQNTVNSVSSIMGGWGGGLAGAQVGAAIGSKIMPGIGTIAGAIIMGIIGGIGGARAAEKIALVLADKIELGIKWLQSQIQTCQKMFAKKPKKV